jgi:hypothetical protein
LELHPNVDAQLRNDIMLLHPTLIPPTTSLENAVENHVIDSHISAESLDETNMSNGVDEGSSYRVQDPVDAKDLSGRSQTDSPNQVSGEAGVSSLDHARLWGNGMSPDSPASFDVVSPLMDPDASSGVARTDLQEDLDVGSGVADGSAHQPVSQRPRTRLQNNTSKPKSFGDDFICLMIVTGEPRDYEEAAT